MLGIPASPPVGQRCALSNGLSCPFYVDPKRFTGACYKAANWLQIGVSAGLKASKKTQGKTPKTVFVYPLRDDYKTILTQNRVWLKPSRKRRPKASQNTAAELPELTQYDPFVHLWQRLIMLLSTVAEEFDAKWRQRRRVIGTLLLMLFIFRLVFSKTNLGYAATVNELWAQCRTMNVPLPQHKPVAASAFCNARKKLDAAIFKTLNTRIIENYEQSTSHHWHGRRLFAVDGSKINLPRPLRDAEYTLPSDKANYPQGLLSCLYQLKSKIPYDFDLSPCLDERKMALAHLRTLQTGDVVVYDRGYFSYAMLYAHQLRKVDVVFRIARRKGKVVDQFIQSDASDAIVHIEVASSRQNGILKKHPHIAFKPLPLRLIKYEMGGNVYILGTTLLDRDLFPKAIFPDLYYARWGIEELYKISKELLQVDEFHARTERGVKQELFAHFVLLTLNRILANHTEEGLNAEQKSASDRPRFQVNIKNALITMARHVEHLFLAHTHLTSKILNTMINAFGYCRQKTRPGRKYPRVSMKPVGKWRASKL